MMDKAICRGCALVIVLYTICNYGHAAVTSRKGVGMVCAEYQVSDARIARQTDDYESDEYELKADNDKTSTKTEKMKEKKCDKETNVCYASWYIDTNGTQIIQIQGCWENTSEHEKCDRDQCISERTLSVRNPHRFCCCTGNMCNTNLTERNSTALNNRNILVIDRHVPDAQNTTFISALKSEHLWIVVSIISIPVALSLVYVIFCRNQIQTEPKIVNVPLPNPKFSSDLLNVDNLKLCSMIGQGKYGTVWKGMINEQTVAVKIFPTQHKEYFLSEKDIYCLPLMDSSPYFLEYFGCDERRTLDDSIEYLLVLSLAPLGCLQEWLTRHTAPFDIYIKMTRSIASGLAHLHTRNANGSLYKPSVVHRDFNSRNILVKNDLTCCVSDFGFALKTFGPRYEWKGSMTLAEFKSLNEVGTIRYMAPEMLEGAVNLRDCETALKQIDIYSLGLILWELFTRCEEFYESIEKIPPYKQPYEDDIGKMPSLEQMQILVSRQKVRPKFSDAWKRNVSAKIAKDTCEDCWDHDPDARLTAICVEERLREMSAHRLQSPTVDELPLSMLPMSSTHHPTAYENPNFIASISNGTSTSNDFKISTRNDGIVYGIKRTNKKFNLNNGGWSKIRSLFAKGMHFNFKRNDEFSILTEDNRSMGKPSESQPPTSIFQQSNLVDNNRVHIKTKHLPQIRPKHLDLALPHINAPNTPESNLLQTPIEPNSSQGRNYQSIYKRPPGDSFSNEQFTIVDESDPQSASSHLRKPTRLVVSKSANAMKSLQNIDCSDEWHVKRQRSLEVFKDVFGVKGSVERLRDPSERIKTPGDVPKSVRRVRASKTLSLYDDRMMNINATSGNTL